MKKRSLIALATALLLLASTTAFAGGEQEEAEPEAEGFNIWHVQTDEGSLRDVFDDVAADFEEDHGVEVEVVPIQNDPYKDRILVAMSAGDPPAIFQTWGGGPLREFIDGDSVHPIDPIHDELLDRYLPGSFDPVTFDDGVYGAAYSGLTGVYFWYRTDIFEEHGVEPPETWSELLDAVDTFNEAGITPISLGNQHGWTGSFYYMYLVDRLGGEDLLQEALFGGERDFEDEAFVRAGEMIRELVDAGAFPDGYNGMDEETARILMYSDQAAMYLMGQWHYPIHEGESPETAEHLDFFPFPEVEEGNGDPSNLVGSPGQDYLAISTNISDVELAYTFFTDYLMNDQWAQFLADNGQIPPVRNARDYLDDSTLEDILVTFEEANHVQVYYDQYMDPALGQEHIELMQALFGGDMSPEEVARRHQETWEDIQEE
ncbi:MAG: extracellular solute-binding protein [Spirochaetaceae bacterium]